MKTEKCHFIGIGGIGMSGLARILLQRQRVVSGSDLATTSVTEALTKLGAMVYEGHSEEQLPREATVVISSDIKPDNPEYQAALKHKLPVIHRSDLLVQLMEGHKGLAVTGTHGKTTTSALLAWVLLQAGLDPAFAIGGWLPSVDTNASAGKGEYFVAEADESDGSFVKYRPFGAIITNIDHDHMNHFGTETKLVNAFKQFVKHVSNPRHLFWCGDDALLRRISPAGISYGFGSDCALHLSAYRQQGWSSTFNLSWGGRDFLDIEIALPGVHSVLNAAAVFGLASSLNIPEESIREAFRTFPGVKRRCECKMDRRGILVIDDYAHHPVEIETTLKGLRRALGDRRLVVVFQPHRYTRTKHCMGQFKNVFDVADELLITDIYAANEEPLPKVSAEAIVSEVQKHSSLPTRYVPRSSLRSTLVAIARPHDVIVTMGAGDVTKLSAELAEHFIDQNPKRIAVGFVCGGASVEHEVSCLSSKQTLPNLKADFYEVKLFGITKEGKWLVGDDVLEKLANGAKGAVDAQRSHPLSQEVLAQLLTCDVLVPMLHGPNGEDGTIQGFFEILGKAYVGCDQRSAAICMDKVVTKRLALAAGIPVAPFLTFSAHEWQRDPERLLAEVNSTLTWPLFVKPRHLGSSIEIHRITNPEELREAVSRIFRVDTHVVVETEMIMRELEFGVLGNDDPFVMPPGEIFSTGRIHSYAGKYSDNPTPDTTKAQLEDRFIEEGKVLAVKAYKAAGCQGLARIDFFFDQQNRYWLSEINPMPGFTKNSMFPRLCVDNALPLAEVMNRLIILALARRRAVQRLVV